MSTNMTDQRELNLLVVEDSESDYLLLLASLQRQGIQLRSIRVETGPDMLAALLSEKFDAIISDHHLPTFSSGQALDVAQENAKEVPFIIVSGTIGEDAAVAAMRNGADDYLIKGRLARLGAALTGAIEAANNRIKRQEAEQALRDSERQLQALSAHLQNAIDAERAEIARDIHDEIGSGLTSLRFDLAWIERNSTGTAAERSVQSQRFVAELMQASQRIVKSLRPPVLDAGIVAALEWQVSRFRERSKLNVRLQCHAGSDDLAKSLGLIVYRTLQEALNNILKHANASKVSISLVVDNNSVSLEINDDGCGISAQNRAKSNSFGLRGLNERARQAGGWLDISSNPGAGTNLLLCLPLDGETATDELDDD